MSKPELESALKIQRKRRKLLKKQEFSKETLTVIKELSKHFKTKKKDL